MNKPFLAAILLVATSVTTAPAALGAGRAIVPSPWIAANDGGTPAVAEAGGRFLTTWVERADIDSSRVMGSLTNGRGERISPSFFIANTRHSWRPAGKRWYALALRLDEDAHVLDARGIPTLAPHSSSVMSVAAAPELGVVFGMQETELLTGARTVLYTEDDLPPLPPPPPPPTNLRRSWSALEWNDTAEGYVVERLNDDGSIQTIATTTEPRLHPYPPKRVRVRAFDGGVVGAPTDWFAPRRRPSGN